MRHAIIKTGYCFLAGLLFTISVAAQPIDNKPTATAVQPPAPFVAPAGIYLPPAYTPGISLNYVRTWEAMGAGYTTEAAFTRAASATDGYRHIKEATQYSDGLGRPIQTVSRQITPGLNPQDLVVPVVYDPFGREQYKFLPYASPSTDGGFKMDPFSEQKTFLQNQHPGEQVFYGKSNFEASPLNRVDKTFSPGNSWAGSEGSNAEHSIQIKYLVNTAADNVRVWEVANNTTPNLGSTNSLDYLFLYTYINIPTTTRSYSAGELTKTVTIDEHGSAVVEYKNKEGLVILKKVQVDDWPPPADYSGYGFMCTYYVYDDFNRLRCVIPPKMLYNLVGSWQLPFYYADQGCFRYEYDERGRMIAKKVPGGGWTYMLYDKRDRLVFSREANMIWKNQWMTTLYDALNRPVVTGMLTYSDTHLQLKTYLDGISMDGYTTQTFSGLNAASSGSFNTTINVNGNPLPAGYEFVPLTITCYDNYDWTNSTYTTAYNSKLTAGANLHALPMPSGASNQTIGLITGTRTRVIENPDDLTQGDWLNTVSFYDDRNRPIQIQSTNYKGGTDIITNLYDFSGKVLSSYAVHQNPAASINMATLSNMEYDHAGRLLSTKKSIFNQPGDPTPALTTTVSELQYDAQGQLLTKNLGQQRDITGNYTNTPLETLDFNYNIRGWLKGINKDYANKTGTNANNRWFGMELNYDWGFGNNQFNGNIGGTKWRSKGDGEQRAYGFTYDRMNRILGADFSQHDGSGYIDNAVINFDMQTGYSYYDSYDENGNLLSMKHWGLKGLHSEKIDDLSYQYNGFDNHLLYVYDNLWSSTNGTLGDFKNGQYIPLDHYGNYYYDILHYQYDLNGNMVSDLNKGIYQELEYGGYNPTKGIKYNYLNLPQVIYKHKEDNSTNPLQGTIKYVYDATGNKLEKIVDEEPLLSNNNQRKITTTTYLGAYNYENGQLQFFAHEEGRFRPLATNPGTWAADYMIKDHLGNVRAVLTDENQQQTYPAATLEGSLTNSADAAYIEKQYYQIDVANVVNKSDALDLPDYPNNNGNPPYNNNPNSTATANSSQLYRLNANTSTAKTGLGITLKVMAGDEVKILGKSYWKTASGDGVSGTPDPVTALDILNAFAGSTSALSGKGITGGDLNGISGVPSAIEQLFSPQQQTPARPQAYINWILFDEQFNPVLQGTNSGFSQVGAEGVLTDHRNSSNDFLTTGQIEKSGYLYVYCSNESRVDVFFDNLQLVHTRGPLLEETHYYPFGLTMAGISSRTAGGVENKIKFQSKELQSKEFSDGSGLEWEDFGARLQDPQLGRFWQVDPLASKYSNMSPYTAMDNNPLSIIDPTGKSGEPVIDKNKKTITITSNLIFYGECATAELAKQNAADIQNQWNGANGQTIIDGVQYSVKFVVNGSVNMNITADEISKNTDIKNNYFKIVDTGIDVSQTDTYTEQGGNTGTWLYKNISAVNSTTEVHEYGHSFGLVSNADGGVDGHPGQSNLLGQTGTPGIMYPRGTAVEAQYTYDPKQGATVINPITGGRTNTMNPEMRKVNQKDIDYLHLEKVQFDSNGKGRLGTLTNIHH